MPSLPVNSGCFLAPDSANDHYREARKGIVHPRYVLLPEGTRLFRFGHSVDRKTQQRIPALINYTSPWWIGKRDFESFLGSSPDSSYGFNKLVRTRMALLSQFGQADRIIEAKLRRPLGAFAGTGQVIVEDSATGEIKPLITAGSTLWVPDAKVTQYFIPGLRGTGGAWASHTYDEAVQILSDFPAREFFLYRA